MSLLNYTREGVSASVSVQDNAYTLSHMTALGTCTVHTTAQEAPPEESGETVRQEIDPFDPSTWPEAYQDQEPSLPPEGGETGDTEAPPETEEPVEQPVESEEPYVPAA